MTASGHNSVAAEQVRSFIDRVLRLKEEADALAEDVREVYAEAKSNGFDKTALGQVVSKLRRRAKNPEREDELSALAELYLTAYQDEAPSRVHARARAAAPNRPPVPPASGGTGPSHTPAGRVADESPATSSPATATGGAAPDRTNQPTKSEKSGNAGTAAGHLSLTGSAAVPDDDIAIPAFLWRAG